MRLFPCNGDSLQLSFPFFNWMAEKTIITYTRYRISYVPAATNRPNTTKGHEFHRTGATEVNPRVNLLALNPSIYSFIVKRSNLT